MIGEQRAVRAVLDCRPLSFGPFDVELRDETPTVVLWLEERPVAVRVRTTLALSLSPANAGLASLLEGEARAAGLVVQHVPEARLWRLFARPPRPWLIR